MSTAKIVTVICWVVVAIVMIGLVIWFLTGSLFGISTGFKLPTSGINIGALDNLTGPFSEAGSYTVPAEGIRSIDVSWTSGEASIAPYDGSVVKITEFARRELQDREKLVLGTSGDRLEVRYSQPGISVNMATKRLEILVPRTIAGSLNAIAVESASAGLKISDFSAKTVSIHETSGTSNITNVRADSVEVRSVSGAINLRNVTASQLSAGTVSGEIELDGVAADTLKANTTSGEQALSGTFKSVTASSVSGEIRVRSSVNPDSMKCDTTSGGITVSIPGSSDLSVSYNTTSGKFHSSIPVRTGGASSYRFSSVSGDIWLKAAS